MPTLSASDYTTFLKFKAAAASPIQQRVQLRDNVSTSQSVISANVLASQAAFVVTPTISTIQGNVRVRPVQPEKTNNPNALSTITGSGTMSSSAIQRPGGLPTGFRGSQNTYHRIPQNAGGFQGRMISSGPKLF
jgi:hypothetical protein